MSELDIILNELTTIQLKYLGARLSTTSDKEAAIQIGLSPQGVYQWHNKDRVNEAVRLARLETVNVARKRLARMVNDAIDVIEDEMKGGRGTSNRLQAAREVLDRTGVTRITGLDITTGGREIGITDESRNRAMAALAEAIGTGMLGELGSGQDTLGTTERPTIPSTVESG